MGLKQCRKCRKTKEHTSFYKNKSVKDGFLHRCIQCIQNTPAYKKGRKNYTKKRQALLEKLKKNVPCRRCNETFPLEVMDFNHIHGEKVANVSQIAVSKVFNEASKCEILCSRCHRIETEENLQKEKFTPKPNSEECIICGGFYEHLKNNICRRCTPACIAKRDFVNKLKGRPCVDCGGTYPPVAMDLDHVRGKKESGISSLLSRNVSLERIKKEASKCVTRCSNCHRIKTFQERRKPK